MNDLEAKARALYEGRDYLSTPTWDQCGEVTKSVWRDFVLKGSCSVLDLAAPAAPATEPPKEVGETFDLF